MYIVQINNPNRFGWKTLPVTNCKFKSLAKAIALYREIEKSPTYAGMLVRVWHVEAESRVDVGAESRVDVGA